MSAMPGNTTWPRPPPLGVRHQAENHNQIHGLLGPNHVQNYPVDLPLTPDHQQAPCKWENHLLKSHTDVKIIQTVMLGRMQRSDAKNFYYIHAIWTLSQTYQVIQINQMLRVNNNLKEEFLGKRLSTGDANNELLHKIVDGLWDGLRWSVTNDGMDDDDGEWRRRWWAAGLKEHQD